MAKKGVFKREALPVPQTVEEAVEILSRIGHEERKIEKVSTEMNEQIEQLKARAIDELTPIQEKMDQLVDAFFAFVQSHRDELTENGKIKTIKWPTGKISWRVTPRKVNLRDIKGILARLKELKLEQFIRTIEEVNKEAILKEQKLAETVKGISVTQTEIFTIEPAKTNIEIIRKINQKKSKKGVE